MCVDDLVFTMPWELSNSHFTEDGSKVGKGEQTSKVTTLKRKLQGCRLLRPHWDQPCDTVISETVPQWSIKECWDTLRAP